MQHDGAATVSKPIHVSLVAIPDAVISTLSGIFDVINGPSLLPRSGQEPPLRPFSVEIVGLQSGPLELASRVPVNVHRSIADIDSTGGQKAMAARCGCYMVKAPHTISEETSRGLFASSVIRSPYINRHVVLVTGQQRPLSRASREVVARLTGIIRELSVPKEITGQSSGRAADNDHS